MKTKGKDKKTVLVTGANGFTGRYVCMELIKRQIPFIGLLREGNDVSWFKKNNLEYRFGDINSLEDLTIAMKGCDSIINIASLGFGSAPNIIKACDKSGISRSVFISTTAIFTKLNAHSKKIRENAESLIKVSNLEWTIIRPTMIYGAPKDRNLIKLIKWIDMVPFFPVFGNGENLQQPVYVRDVAWSIAEVLHNKKTYYESFNISGRYPLSFNNLVKTTSKSLNKETILIHLPSKIFIIILKFFEYFDIKLPIKAEQIERLNEDKSFDSKKAKKIFKYDPKPFSFGIKKEIEAYLSIRNK